MAENDDEPPEGFRLTKGEGSRLTVRYRMTAGGQATRMFARRFAAGTIGSVLAIGWVVFAPGGVDYLLLVTFVLGAVAQFVVAGYVAWLVWSVTVFTFGTEELVVERSLLGYRRRKVFRRSEVRLVAQEEAYGTGSQCWSLVIVAGARIKLLSNQLIDASQWLGSFVARWAGVPFETVAFPEQQ